MIPKKEVENEVTLRVLDTFVRAAVAEYPSDPCKASVTLSLLADGQYYGSVVRYTEAYGKGKVVVCSARAPSLEECVRLLGQEWLSRRSAANQLAASLGTGLQKRGRSAAFGSSFDDDCEWGK